MPSSQAGPPGDPTTSPDHERAAEAVRRRRLELGWTQEQLAERSGVSAATVRKVEGASQTHYRDLTCTRLCTALGWTSDALDVLRSPTRRTAADDVPSSPPPTDIVRSASPGGSGAPREVELAALNGRLTRLDARQWERLVAFVDGLTATDS